MALVAAGLGILAASRDVLRRTEQQAIDARFAIRGTDRHALAGLVLVDVDAATFNAFRDRGLHAQWPFPRRYHARVIDQLRRAGAKVIAVDIQFTEPTDVTDDNALIAAVGRAGNVVLSTTDVGPHGSTTVLGGDAVLRQFHARAGEASVAPDTDGSIRNTQYAIGGLPTFGVAVAEAATGHPVAASRYGGSEHQVPIDYAGPPGTLPAVSYARVYDGHVPRAAFAGKVVIVGSSAPALQDVHQTSTSGGVPMAGPEILANEASTALRGVPLREPPGWVAVLLIATLALLGAAAGLRLGTLGVALTGAAILALWALATQLAFNSGTLLDFSDPAAALLLAAGATIVVSLWEERRERHRLRLLFAADAPAVVEGVLHEGGGRSLEPTAIIAGYRIEAPIARGGMGVVYRARQLALDRTVALKLIAPDRAQDPVFRARFELESRLAASLEHVNVIPVYEAGDDDGLLFISMRLVDGVDLEHLLERGGPLEPARAARLIGQLAAALDAAHAHGLVHRDVKPGNVLLTLDEPEHVYLTDFGVAKHIGGSDGMTTAGAWVGTLDYLAPEQISGDEVGASADVYALACVLYRCLTGEVPFPRDNEAAKLWAQVNASPPAVTASRPELPAAIDAVVARGMAKDPAARFTTATDLARACSMALGVAVVGAPESSPPASAPSDGPRPEPPAPAAPTVISD